ncbi:hypothetical protein JK211_14445 [Tatumella sp. JGM130]|uniref:hypothetical protein n=1 Tax=Tatumella sp. JGM130 TaxID=2799797 RepID=UPI001BAF35EF|nr:hypothetical protein [Tatumella sp. JGM130]MBS0895214.1 hypothetical protein [Tatumella sp. JGM130]
MTKRIILFSTIILSILVPQLCFADTNVDTSQLASNVNETSKNVIYLINGLALLFGLLMTYKSVMRLKEMADSPQKGITLGGPILMMACAAFVVQFAFSIQVGSNTLGASGSMLSLDSQTHTSSGDQTLEQLINAALMMVKALGVGASLVAFVKLYQKGVGVGDVKYGEVFIMFVSGLCCVHIEWFISLIMNTFGVTSTFLTFT